MRIASAGTPTAWPSANLIAADGSPSTSAMRRRSSAVVDRRMLNSFMQGKDVPPSVGHAPVLRQKPAENRRRRSLQAQGHRDPRAELQPPARPRGLLAHVAAAALDLRGAARALQASSCLGGAQARELRHDTALAPTTGPGPVDGAAPRSTCSQSASMTSFGSAVTVSSPAPQETLSLSPSRTSMV